MHVDLVPAKMKGYNIIVYVNKNQMSELSSVLDFNLNAQE